MKFGENLKKLRKSKSLSQEDLACKVGVSRQSVSKWETGEAYPEMTNILALCDIFKCKINDLVNESLVDVDSLDEEVKMNVVKFKEEKQKKVKVLSKATYIISRICKIFSIICGIILLIMMVLSPFVMDKVEISNNDILVGDHIIGYISKEENMSMAIKILENNSHVVKTLCLEAILLFALISFILMYMILDRLEKLFVNIHNGDTPFTLDNVSYIFEYGYEIQLDSKGRMYGK